MWQHRIIFNYWYIFVCYISYHIIHILAGMLCRPAAPLPPSSSSSSSSSSQVLNRYGWCIVIPLCIVSCVCDILSSARQWIVMGLASIYRHVDIIVHWISILYKYLLLCTSIHIYILYYMLAVSGRLIARPGGRSSGGARGPWPATSRRSPPER